MQSATLNDDEDEIVRFVKPEIIKKHKKIRKEYAQKAIEDTLTDWEK